MNRFSFHFFCGAVLAFVFSLFAAPVLAQETFAYPQDFPPRVLQNIGSVVLNSVAPTGSDTGKSTSLSGNNVTVNSGTISGDIYGAHNIKDSEATTGNRVTVSGGTVSGWVYGADSRVATNNTVIIKGGTMMRVLGGNGNGYGSVASGNNVFISGGTINDWVIGGEAWVDPNDLDNPSSMNNSITISGGTVNGGICGGQIDSPFSTPNGTVADNTVTILGAPIFGSNVGLYGGCSYGLKDGKMLRNTLNIHSSGLIVGGMGSFQNLNFYLPVTMKTGDAMLIVAGTADIADVTTINVSLDGVGPALQTGNRYILMTALKGSFGNLTLPAMTRVVGNYTSLLVIEGNSLVLIIGAKQPGPTRDYTGQWFNVSEDNWGLSIFQNFPGKPLTIFVPWYTYDSNGKAAWYVFQGDSWSADDVVSADVYRYTGPNWGTTPYDNSKITNTKVGTAKLTFTSATTVHFEYTVDGAGRSVDLQKLQ